MVMVVGYYWKRKRHSLLCSGLPTEYGSKTVHVREAEETKQA